MTCCEEVVRYKILYGFDYIQTCLLCVFPGMVVCHLNARVVGLLIGHKELNSIHISVPYKFVRNGWGQTGSILD